MVTTTVPPVVAPQISSDALSKTSITLTSDINSNAIYWTIKLCHLGGRLPATAGAQLCAPGSSPGLDTWCTGATMGRSGTAYSATYKGLFLISSAAERGSCYPSVFGRWDRPRNSKLQDPRESWSNNSAAVSEKFLRIE